MIFSCIIIDSFIDDIHWIKQKGKKEEEQGKTIKTVEIPLFLRDHYDYDVGDPQYQGVYIHNICVKLQTYQPLNKDEMGFLKIQNFHLETQAKKKATEETELCPNCGHEIKGSQCTNCGLQDVN